MIDTSSPKTVLVVDNDLGFLALLCHALTEGGFLSVPAVAPEQVIPLLEELEISRVDLLLINLAVPGTTDLIKVIREQHEVLKIIAIEDPRLPPITKAAVDAVIQKPLGAALGREWLRTVQKVLDL